MQCKIPQYRYQSAALVGNDKIVFGHKNYQKIVVFLFDGNEYNKFHSWLK